jgi:hypothetical protein
MGSLQSQDSANARFSSAVFSSDGSSAGGSCQLSDRSQSCAPPRKAGVGWVNHPPPPRPLETIPSEGASVMGGAGIPSTLQEEEEGAAAVVERAGSRSSQEGAAAAGRASVREIRSLSDGEEGEEGDGDRAGSLPSLPDSDVPEGAPAAPVKSRGRQMSNVI